MKKMFLLLIVLFFIITCLPLYAHSPVRIDISYDAGTKMMTAVIHHPVSDTNAHYINKVIVKLNGKKIIEQRISRQDKNRTQTVKYRIPGSKPYDTISVDAYCSIGGRLTNRMTLR